MDIPLNYYDEKSDSILPGQQYRDKLARQELPPAADAEAKRKKKPEPEPEPQEVSQHG
jgi:hypothetical protein